MKRMTLKLNLVFNWVMFLGGFSVQYLWDLKAFEGQGLRARLCCRKYLIPYFGYTVSPHVD